MTVRAPEAMGEEGVVAALREVREPLAAYRLHHFVAIVDELIDLALQDREKFRHEVTSNNLWGGSGSVCDLHLPLNWPRPGVWQDQKRLDLALVKLALELEGMGLANHRTRAWLETFRTWAEAGIYENPPGESRDTK